MAAICSGTRSACFRGTFRADRGGLGSFQRGGAAAVSVGDYLGVDPATAGRIRDMTDKKTLEYISTPTLAAPGGWLEELLFNVRSCLKWAIKERAALKLGNRKMNDFTKEMADMSKYRFTKDIDRCLNEMTDIVGNDAAEYLKD